MKRRLFFVLVGIFLIAYTTVQIAKSNKSEPVKTAVELETLSPEEEKRKAVKEAEALKLVRTAYQKELRNHYLDTGLDIKVTVHGKQKEKLLLEYALFNDVWKRKMEKAGNFQEWHKLGFKEVILSDGYNYREGYTWQD